MLQMIIMLSIIIGLRRFLQGAEAGPARGGSGSHVSQKDNFSAHGPVGWPVVIIILLLFLLTLEILV